MRDRLYISRHLITTQLILSTALTTFVVGCDSTSAGHDEDPAGGPVLVKIMLQDRDRRGGRGLATDLLNKSPARTCDALTPCAAGMPECRIAAGQTTGVCPDPLKVEETPPAIGIGGNQIRLVFNKLLDPSLDEKIDAEGIVKVLDESGAEIAYKPAGAVHGRYFDPTGDPYLSSSVIAAPYGPAIVVKNATPYSAGSTYTIQLDLAKIVDRTGGTPTNDINGAISSSYTFTMEGLYANAVTPDFVADPAVVVAPDDFFVIETNGLIDAATVTSTVVTVKNEAGATIKTRAFPVDCDFSIAGIARVDDAGAPVAWEPGTYTIEVRVKGDNGKTVITYDVGGTPFDGGFVVDAGATATNSIDGLSIPTTCE